MRHQQSNTRATTGSRWQCDDDSATAWIDAQTDAARPTITSPFDSRWAARQRKHFRSRQFHPAQKRQNAPIRQPA
jgi:hypothetical protein